jgi:hypothetical protein
MVSDYLFGIALVALANPDTNLLIVDNSNRKYLLKA